MSIPHSFDPMGTAAGGLVPFVQPVMTSRDTWSNSPSCGWEVTSAASGFALAQAWQALADPSETAFYPFTAWFQSSTIKLTLKLEKRILLSAVTANRLVGSVPKDPPLSSGSSAFRQTILTLTAALDGVPQELGTLTLNGSVARLDLPAPIWVDELSFAATGGTAGGVQYNTSCVTDLQFIAQISPL